MQIRFNMLSFFKNITKGMYYKKIGLEYWAQGLTPEAHVALLTAHRLRPRDRQIREILCQSFSRLRMTWL